MELQELVSDIADAIARIDASGSSFRSFQPGVGPYGEPQLVMQIAAYLNGLTKFRNAVRSKRTPDLLVPGEWAIEFKLTRPYGDNGKEAENWSVNLLHPYPGNVSSIGDCFKLSKLAGPEQKAVVVIGYEHIPPRIDLMPLVESFEIIAKHVAQINLSPRIEACRKPLVHPVHQSVRIFAWQLL
jgi:hypothetical protein